MQMAVVEFARHACQMEQANSTEFAPQTPYPVVDMMEEQRDVTALGATMRLGAYPCRLQEGSLAHQIYQQQEINERHRHRYEINNSYREQLAQGGLIFCGVSPDEKLVEMIELATNQHPFFLGCQFHPEFVSRPFKPHPIFDGFIRAALAHQQENKQ